MVFSRKSPPGCAFRLVSWSGKEVAERNSLMSRDFSIISRRKSISLSCLAWIAATAETIADIIALVIDCWREESIV